MDDAFIQDGTELFVDLFNYWRETDKWPDLCRPVGEDDFECD